MDIQESVKEKESITSAAEGQPDPARILGRPPIDRLELQHPWVHLPEEEQVEAALNRYAQAARERLQGGAQAVPDREESEEEREARSQQLKLQQKCQDIAALIMVDELEDEDFDKTQEV